jgi:hypothetical protein
MPDGFDLDDFLDEVHSYKAAARQKRDSGDWGGADATLQPALTLAEAAVSQAGPRYTGQIEAQLADLYGMIGGNERRWGLDSSGLERHAHLTASVDAYDRGFEVERRLRGRASSTYNRINRLIGRVLLDPAVLSAGRSGTASIDMNSELDEAEQLVWRQIESARQRDPWAYCDLATVRLLRGSPDASAANQTLFRLAPRAFVYESHLATLEPLADAAGDLLPELAEAVDLVRKAAEQAV